jgi:hypothetical protein
VTMFNVDRTAWALIRKYGGDAAIAAYGHAQLSVASGCRTEAVNWLHVLRRLGKLSFVPPAVTATETKGPQTPRRPRRMA